MKIAFTANGPGEVAGWLRPLLFRLYERDSSLDAHVFLVPDDYATGNEGQVLRRHFPRAVVHEAKGYWRSAVLRDAALHGLQIVQYLGGDLMHAAQLRRRFGGLLTSYKFAARRYARSYARVFALDAGNADRIEHAGVARERVSVIGNLAIDGALLEAQGRFGAAAQQESEVLILPGSRRAEVAHLVPFFLACALALQARDPNLRIVFGISPFTERDALAAALAKGGDPRFYGATGRLEGEGESEAIVSAGLRFPVTRHAIAAAAKTRFALTIPGTKCIELAALGVPMLVCTPLNAPEFAAINGPLTYLDRLPLAGKALKRAAVLGVSRRFAHFAQPNIDAGEELVGELRGTLTPGRVAAVMLERYADGGALSRASGALKALYAAHAGAADRMAGELLALAR